MINWDVRSCAKTRVLCSRFLNTCSRAPEQFRQPSTAEELFDRHSAWSGDRAETPLQTLLSLHLSKSFAPQSVILVRRAFMMSPQLLSTEWAVHF
jgi:hypothetical protein